MHAMDLIGPSLHAAVAGSTLSVLKGRCEIILHDWNDEVWARGAASLVLEGLYRKPWSSAVGATIEITQQPNTTRVS